MEYTCSRGIVQDFRGRPGASATLQTVSNFVSSHFSYPPCIAWLFQIMPEYLELRFSSSLEQHVPRIVKIEIKKTNQMLLC